MKLIIALLAGVALSSVGAIAAEPAAHADHADHDYDTPAVATLAPTAAAAAGIVIARAGPAELQQTLALQGRIAPTSDGAMQVAAPFAGIVETVAVEVGERVAEGALLATVRSSDSLQRYSVRAPRAGEVIERNLAPGSATDGQPLLTLADLDRVWALVAAFPADLPRLRAGQPAALASPFATGGRALQPATAGIEHIASVVSASRAATVRIPLANGDRRWRLGEAVTATITVAQVQVPLAVEVAAVQQMEGAPVLFVRKGDRFAARPVTLGRRDRQRVEVLAGLAPGEEYVAANSFLLKAELLKSGAGHAH